MKNITKILLLVIAFTFVGCEDEKATKEEAVAALEAFKNSNYEEMLEVGKRVCEDRNRPFLAAIIRITADEKASFYVECK